MVSKYPAPVGWSNLHAVHQHSAHCWLTQPNHRWTRVTFYVFLAYRVINQSTARGYFLRESRHWNSTEMLTNRKHSFSTPTCCIIATSCFIMLSFQFKWVRVAIKPWRWLGHDAHVTFKCFYGATVKGSWNRNLCCANRWELWKTTHFFILFEFLFASQMVWFSVCPTGASTEPIGVPALQKIQAHSYHRSVDDFFVRYLSDWRFRQIEFLRFFFLSKFLIKERRCV